MGGYVFVATDLWLLASSQVVRATLRRKALYLHGSWGILPIYLKGCVHSAEAPLGPGFLTPPLLCRYFAHNHGWGPGCPQPHSILAVPGARPGPAQERRAFSKFDGVTELVQSLKPPPTTQA